MGERRSLIRQWMPRSTNTFLSQLPSYNMRSIIADTTGLSHEPTQIPLSVPRTKGQLSTGFPAYIERWVESFNRRQTS